MRDWSRITVGEWLLLSRAEREQAVTAMRNWPTIRGRRLVDSLRHPGM